MLFAYDFNFTEEYIQNYIVEIQNLSESNNGLPLGLSVDEEGGGVTRISKYKAYRNERFPSPKDLRIFRLQC